MATTMNPCLGFRYLPHVLALTTVCFLLLNRKHVTKHVNDVIFTHGPKHPYPPVKPVFTKRPFVIWSNDYHIGPIRDLKDLLQPLGVKFIDKTLSGHCHLTSTCEHNLTIINKANAMGLDSEGLLIEEFYNYYRTDPEMMSVDAFVCFHPSAMCELFLPFNRSVFVIASTRYELGRFLPLRWMTWNENLIEIAGHPYNVVAGNNLYDAKYIQYFTGVKAQVLTSFCGYIDERYTGHKDGFILAPPHKEGFSKIFQNAYDAACNLANCNETIFNLRARYPHYEYSDLCAHKGIVYIPYQVSVMSMFEQYRMNIPLFFPSKILLGNWQQEYMIMNERTWDGVFKKIPSGSNLPPHPSQSSIPDPNSETNRTAINYWIQFADFYTFPHITYYDSATDLVRKLAVTDLQKTSAQMARYNLRFREKLLKQWTDILLAAARHSPNHPDNIYI